MNRRRILVVTSNLAAATDPGVAAAGQSWRLALSELGDDVEGLVLAPGAKNAPRHERFGRLDVRRVGPVRPLSSFADALRGAGAPRVAAVTLSMWTAARRALRSQHFDLVHAVWAAPAGLVCAHPRPGVPLLVTCPGSDVHSWARRPLVGAAVRSVLRRADAVSCYSTEGLEVARAAGARWVHSLDNCYDDRTFTLTTDAPRGRTLLYAGRMTKAKGIFVLAEALERLAAAVPDLRFVTCGAGPDGGAFEARVRRVLGTRAVFLGPQPPRRVAAEMRRARVVVLPSFGEGMSASVIEALACGRPVVTTDSGEHARIVDRGGGSVVPAGDPGALAGALRHELHTRHDGAHLARTVERYTPRRVADRLLELYDVVVAGPAAEPVRRPAPVAHSNAGRRASRVARRESAGAGRRASRAARRESVKEGAA